MTLRTIKPSRNMPFVGKPNMIWKIVHFYPLERLPIGIHIAKLLNIRTVQLHYLVTVHANIHSRHNSVLRFINSHMTILARDLIISGVKFMAKGNRLLWSITSVVAKFHQTPHSKCQ